MSGIGAGQNKFETCKGCPHRSIEPNCHATCEGYIARCKSREEKRQKRIEQANRAYDDLQYDHKTENLRKRKR